jgi:hypothetical protein
VYREAALDGTGEDVYIRPTVLRVFGRSAREVA